MRSIGVASRALDMLLLRVSDPKRKTFGKQFKDHGTFWTQPVHSTGSHRIGTVLADIAHSRAEIDQARFLVLAAARQIDKKGAKGALKDVGVAKVSQTLSTRFVYV